MTQKIEILDKLLNSGLQKLDLDPKRNIKDLKEDFHKLKNETYKIYKIKKPFASIELIERYQELKASGEIEENLVFEKVLRKRGVRSLSGVTVISLLTEFFGCPAKCVYCPTFEGLPKSYIPDEPAVQRAKLNNFDPILQIHNRLRALEITGHKIEKNDVRIIGGTWSVYPKKYRDNFIKSIYDAFNSYDEMKKHIEETDLGNDRFASFKIKESYKMQASKNLAEAKKKNETARCRVIGMAIETRPDWINDRELLQLREYGVTRVEIGYQTTFDKINELNKRGHGNAESIQATKMLKNAGFKVVAHMMPNLLGSTPEMDKQAMKEVFANPDFRPDELKIYPMVVTDKSELTKIWKNGGFKAYDDETLINLTVELESMIPEYVRINRTYRDIPASQILEGSKLANLRQIVEDKIKNRGLHLVDIRHREIKDKGNNPKNAVLHDCFYEASQGMEHFLTFEDPEDRTIFSLLRLRLPEGSGKLLNYQIESLEKEEKLQEQTSPQTYPPRGEGVANIDSVFPELKGAALIREIHTFGDQLSIGEKNATFGQHLGFGKRLIEKAEQIAKDAGYKKMAVIAGVGVRAYYEKRGYILEGEYMTKKLD